MKITDSDLSGCLSLLLLLLQKSTLTKSHLQRKVFHFIAYCPSWGEIRNSTQESGGREWSRSHRIMFLIGLLSLPFMQSRTIWQGMAPPTVFIPPRSQCMIRYRIWLSWQRFSLIWIFFYGLSLLSCQYFKLKMFIFISWGEVFCLLIFHLVFDIGSQAEFCFSFGF